jgi:glycosyltransferase involved in cell wall biosynthesis
MTEAMRFAFLTPEYAGEDTRGGGLAAYVRAMAHALAEHGHEVEVFTTARAPGDGGAGVRVHRLRDAHSRAWMRAFVRGLRAVQLLRVPAVRRAVLALTAVLDGLSFARALAARERSVRFDAVQSSDYGATGLFVPGRLRRGRPHLVRASCDQSELALQDGEDAGSRRWLDALQRRCLRRADVSYAPSRFLAAHYACRHRIHLSVARPPAPAIADLPEPPEDLPKRYFVHFGHLSPAKGTVDLAAALPMVWERAGDFEMVWAGLDRAQRLPAWRAEWGARQRQVHWLGELPRAELLAIVARADAAVLPSRFDNLPNTVIECLALGVPVIGTAGASVDELVTPGRDGELVPVADPEALAAAIVERWNATGPVRAGVRLPEALAPGAAVGALLLLAGLGEADAEACAP